jgi:hypothetical protein
MFFSQIFSLSKTLEFSEKKNIWLTEQLNPEPKVINEALKIST